jgi:hypothetical protein
MNEESFPEEIEERLVEKFGSSYLVFLSKETRLLMPTADDDG